MINKLKTMWGAFAWFHLTPESIRSRYHDALAENIALHHRCDELQTAAELWEEAYHAMRTAYVMLKDARRGRVMDSSYSRMVEAQAICSYGMEHQLRKFHEEIGEALQAVNKYLNGEDTLEHLAEELADLSVTTEEMVIGFGVERQYKSFRDAKLDKLWAKILEREGVATNHVDETDDAT